MKGYSGRWLTSELSALGYRTLGISCNPWVGSWGGFDRAFERFRDIRPWQHKPRNRAARLVRRARQMHLLKGSDHGGRAAVAQLARSLDDEPSARLDPPWFAYVNLMEAHAPYDPPLRFHPAVVRREARRSSVSRTRIPRYQSRQVKLRESPEPQYLAAIRLLYEASARYQG